MITVDVPGWGNVTIAFVLLDLNGTLSVDGALVKGVRERILDLSRKLEIHVLTADTLGKADVICQGLPVILHIISDRDQVTAKRDYLKSLPAGAAVIGNGRNDVGMLSEATLGIAVLGVEGTSSEAIIASDIVVREIDDALDLLLNPARIKATLRS